MSLKRLKSKCWKGCVSSRGSRERLFLRLFHAGRQHSFICSPIIPMPVTVVTQPSPLLLGNSAYVPPIRIYVVARRIHWDKLLTYLKILNAIISAKSVTTT